MKRITIFLGIVGLLVLIACDGQKESKSDSKTQQIKETVVEKVHYYTCPMEEHKHVNSDKSGDCPECGMKLVAAVDAEPDDADYYGCPMPEHSHIRHEKSGKCEECNMELKSMRLVTQK